MSLIKCTECGKEISDKASACINCGAPIEKETASEQEPEYLAGCIQEVAPLNRPYFLKLQDQEGFVYFANRDVDFTSPEAKDVSQLNAGDLVYFKDDFVEGRVTHIEQRRMTTEAAEVIKQSFQEGKDIVVTETSQKRGAPKAGKSEEVTKTYLWYLLLFVIVAGYWIAKGTPNPALFFAASTAKEECVGLAEENRESFLIGSGEVTANDTWISKGKRVVQLILRDDDGDLRQIMCLYGNGMVSIPSALEQGRWR